MSRCELKLVNTRRHVNAYVFIDISCYPCYNQLMYLHYYSNNIMLFAKTSIYLGLNIYEMHFILRKQYLRECMPGTGSLTNHRSSDTLVYTPDFRYMYRKKVLLNCWMSRMLTFYHRHVICMLSAFLKMIIFEFSFF